MESAPHLDEGIAALGAERTVVIDMAATTYCDSWGLNLLVRQQQRLSAAGGRLVIRNPPAMFRRLLTVCGLEEILPVESSPAGGPIPPGATGTNAGQPALPGSG